MVGCLSDAIGRVPLLTFARFGRLVGVILMPYLLRGSSHLCPYVEPYLCPYVEHPYFWVFNTLRTRILKFCSIFNFKCALGPRRLQLQLRLCKGQLKHNNV